MNIKEILYTAVCDEHFHEVFPSDLTSANIIQVSDDTLHIIEGTKSTIVRVVNADYKAKEFVLRIGRKEIAVKLRDEVETRVHAMGFDVNRNHVKQGLIASPMPGTVLKILASVGTEVNEGDPIIVLEAMKMENVLIAPADGIISKIHVREKQNVDKNQVLVEF